MNTKQYVREFYRGGDKPLFRTDAFLIEFGKEFQDRLKVEQSICKRNDSVFTYQKFQQLVKEMDNKFKSINNKLAGMELHQRVFNSFFSGYVIPQRASIFPDIHAAISAKREEYLAAEAERREEEEALRESEFVVGAYIIEEEEI